jgi:hypothetical protein
VGLLTPIEEIEGDAEIVENARQILLDGVRRIASEVRSSWTSIACRDDTATVSRAVMTGRRQRHPRLQCCAGGRARHAGRGRRRARRPRRRGSGRLTVAAGLALDEALA